MTGTNHALTGAVIVAIISVPVIALPLAFLSHFALDTLPHFGEIYNKRKALSKSIWIIDAVLLTFLLVGLIISTNWLLLAGALLALSPDFAWVYRFVVSEKFGKLPPKPTNRFNKFHAGIQKLETKQGLVVEILWFMSFSVILLRYL